MVKRFVFLVLLGLLSWPVFADDSDHVPMSVIIHAIKPNDASSSMADRLLTIEAGTVHWDHVVDKNDQDLCLEKVKVTTLSGDKLTLIIRWLALLRAAVILRIDTDPPEDLGDQQCNGQFVITYHRGPSIVMLDLYKAVGDQEEQLDMLADQLFPIVKTDVTDKKWAKQFKDTDKDKQRKIELKAKNGTKKAYARWLRDLRIIEVQDRN